MEIKDKNDVKTYLDDMVKTISKKRISVILFDEYYNNLFGLIDAGLIEDPIPYLLALRGATVERVRDNDDKYIFSKGLLIYQKISSISRKQLDERLFDLKDWVSIIFEKIKGGFVSGKEFLGYFDTFNLLYHANILSVEAIAAIANLLVSLHISQFDGPKQQEDIKQIKEVLKSLGESYKTYLPNSNRAR